MPAALSAQWRNNGSVLSAWQQPAMWRSVNGVMAYKRSNSRMYVALAARQHGHINVWRASNNVSIMSGARHYSSAA